MTTEEYNILNQITYSDFGFNGIDTSGTLQEICQRVVDSGTETDSSVFKAIAEGQYPGLSNLTYVGGQNSNDTTGFVAYAFRNGDTTICTYRGSEGGMSNFRTEIDWADNIMAGLEGDSVQYQEAVEFAKNMSNGGSLEVSGHSKGGNLALYVASQSDNCIGGKTFNSQGFPEGYLSDSEIQRLQDSGVTNYVAENDFVGSLCTHYENREFVKGGDFSDAHSLTTIKFENGEPIEGKQSNVTKIVETVSRRVTKDSYEAPAVNEKIRKIKLSGLMQNEIVVSPEEIMTGIGRFNAAQEHLREAAEALDRTQGRVNDLWISPAKGVMMYQWTKQRMNINEADARMKDAVDELKFVYSFFTQQEERIAGSASALDIGTSPFV